MNQDTHHGYLILADISGYTSYLKVVELTHARDILAELLGLIVEHFKPLLTIVQLEGDAVFAHVSQTKIQRGELLLELIESTYLAFKDRVESIRRRTTCECNACRAIPGLDLKFILHFGEYLLHNVSGNIELIGSDVNLAHRLLNNQLSEVTGWKAYALITGSALTQMNVKPDGLHELVESYEYLGDIRTHSLDLHACHKELIDARRVLISAGEADRMIVRTIPAAPVVVWEWLNDIQKRLMWEAYKDIRPLLRPGGRTGTGRANHCAHGKNLVLETILDWRPFEYYTIEHPMAVQSKTLEPVPDGTRLTFYFKLKKNLPRWLTHLLAQLMFRMFRVEQQYDTLLRLIAEDAAREESHG